MKKVIASAICAAACFLAAACGKQEGGKTVLHVGHFPNISHAQALVAHQLSRQGKGWFERYLGDGVELQWHLFNAGPSAMESMFSGAVDITYVGPSPAINAFAKTGGEDIRILSGAADGGASLVVNPALNISKPSDFAGKRIGTPQLGNTQDVACRAWLIDNGMNVTLTGGDAYVIATSNPEQLPLFKQGKLDAVWTFEPWVTRLLQDAGGKIYLSQDEAVTTILATGNRTLKKHPELVKKFIAAHKELTEWIKKNPDEAQKLAHAELESLTGGKVSFELVKAAWPHLIFTSDVNKAELQKFVDRAYSCGFLKERTDISKIFYE